MSVNSNQPRYVDFMKNEVRTLQFISSNGTIQSKFRPLAISCERTYQTYKGLNDRTLSKSEFIFSTSFDLQVEKKEQHVVIECKVASGYEGIVSYVLSMCELKDDGNLHLLRKFHFDYALPIKGDNIPKPVYHLQYGGKQTPQLKSLNIGVDHLHNWLSTPRLAFVPINIALLVDMMFCEFRSETTERITENRKWREHIKSNEEFLLVPYYEKFRNFLTGSHKFDSLIRDYNYGR
jgi:hypothetical protein